MTTSSTNVDPREIANFDRLAAQWWDPRGEMRALHAINAPRVRYIADCLGGASRLQGLKALDVGCGGGLLTEALASAGADALGIDLAADALAVAEGHAKQTGNAARYRQIAAEDLAAAQPQQFDLVCCMEMLEHVPEPSAVVAACAQLLKPGGTLVLSTINRNPKSFALMIVGAEYVLNLVPRGTHTYEKFIKPSELDAWSRAAGLDVVGLRGLQYNPLLQSASLSSDVDVNYLMHCTRPA
ncbi:MAG TPA: bifunctional 2-polyprenyl-6-hydroxyphenol methylase/3-demethylubiquinol 3-O-methyltransferase UbiG [Fontimonas sp.]